MMNLCLGEFDRQTRNLLDKGYPKIAGMSARQFMRLLAPLRRHVPTGRACGSGIPFIIVVRQELVAAGAAMRQVRGNGEKGHVDMRPVTPDRFQPLTAIALPRGMVYLLRDVDTGRKSLNVTVARALPAISRRCRSPLTIDEGVALVTHFPEVLTDKQRYNCVWLAGSRGSDQRVPALWISYGRPRLGWCWENTPHTWLGCASCGERIGSGKS